jgi:hypothetical protein
MLFPAVVEVQTQCSLSFGMSAKSLAAVGGFLVATGSIATAGVAFCIWSIRRSAGKEYGNASPVIPAFGMAPQAQPQQQPMKIEPAPGPGMQQAYPARPQETYYAQGAPGYAQPGYAGVGAPGGAAYGRPPQYY